MIYIATNEHGRGVKHITAFADRLRFLCYADEVLACDDSSQLIRAKSTPIERICEALYDSGIGFGARDHHRVSRQDAQEYIRNGAKATDCWNL